MKKPSERMKHVRLSRVAIKGFRLEHLKLHKFKPLQELLGKLSGSKRVEVARPTVSDIGSDPSALKSSKGTQLAFNLLLVRPWVLVVGFWLVSMVSAGIALEGLISPRRLTMDMPVASSAPVAPEDSFISVEPSADEIADQAANPDSQGIFIAPPETSRSNFPAWPLGALVGTCAAGCLVMSRRRAMARMSAARSRSTLRNESRGRGRKVRLSSDRAGHSAEFVRKLSDRKVVQVPIASGPTASQPAFGKSTASRSTPGVHAATKPLAPKISHARKPPHRRQRSSQQPTLPKPVARSRVLASQTVQQAAPVSRVSKPNSGRRLSFQVANRQTVVTVVPANEAHPLDWDSGSLAHERDVRPQRSAM